MWCAWVCAARKGDGLADLGFGIGGGGMSISVLSWSASGDTELLCSESVVPGVAEDEVGSAGNGSCCSCSAASTNSLSICSFMRGVEAAFFRCGLVIGDCRTLAFALLGAFFLAFFVVSPEPVINPEERGEFSMPSLTGLVVIERCVCSYDIMLSL
jgi:hypothetical protein